MTIAADTPEPRRLSLTTGAILVTGAAGIFVLSGYVVNVWLGRLLGPADYGRFGIVIGLVTILNVIQNTSIPQAVARTVANAPEHARGALRQGAELQLTVSLVMAAGLVLAAPLVATGLGDPALTDLIRLSAVTLVPYGALALLIAFHNGSRSYVRQAAASATYAIAKGVGAVGLAHAFQVAGAVAGYVVAAVVGVGVAWRSAGGAVSRIPYVELLGFAVPVALYAIASVALMSIDIFFVKAGVADERSAGYYAASQSISRIPFYVMTGLASVILPAVAGASKRGRYAATKTSAEAVRWSLIVVLPLVAVMIPTSDAVLSLLYSDEYRPGGPALAILAPGLGALAITSILAGLLAGVGRPWLPALFASGGLVVTVVACATLVPAAGTQGAALGTLLGVVVAFAGTAVALWRELPGVASPVTVVRIALVAVAAGAIALVIDPVGLGVIAVYAALALGVVGVLLFTGDLPASIFGRLRSA